MNAAIGTVFFLVAFFWLPAALFLGQREMDKYKYRHLTDKRKLGIVHAIAWGGVIVILLVFQAMPTDVKKETPTWGGEKL